MRVLVITGDKNFKPGHPRYELQRGAVEELGVVYWGRGSLNPTIPQGPFDVVTAQDPLWRGHFAWHVSRRLKTRLNLQVHTDLKALSSPMRLWAGFNLRRADSVRVVSEKIKQQVIALGIRAPVFVLPVYIDVEKFHAVTPVSHSQKTIVWIGRFEAEKNPLLALKIIRMIPEAKLIMLGKGSMEGVLRKRAQEVPVEFPGWQDPAPFLAQADVVLSTSNFESYGASIVEALAAGVPVVAPDVGVAKEAGAVVVPREKLAAAVIEVLKTGVRGKLLIEAPSAKEWQNRWRKTLL